MEDITYVDYRHTKRVFKCFNNKNLDHYQNFYVQSDTLLLRDAFKNFRKKMYWNVLINLSAPRLAWQTWLKKTGVKLELLMDIDMLLMVEKGIRGGIYHAVHR